MAVTKASATYWEGKADAESLQRIYGISFPDNKLMKEWKLFQVSTSCFHWCLLTFCFQEEAAKRDHRKIGLQQDLFFFHELSPGSCFFQPKGAHIYNKLLAFLKEEYWKRGFQEVRGSCYYVLLKLLLLLQVISPNIYNAKLWQTSGHWDHYAEGMFKFEVEKEAFGLKPMNCPGHCLMFDQTTSSYKDLPLRMADFGVRLLLLFLITLLPRCCTVTSSPVR